MPPRVKPQGGAAPKFEGPRAIPEPPRVKQRGSAGLGLPSWQDVLLGEAATEVGSYTRSPSCAERRICHPRGGTLKIPRSTNPSCRHKNWPKFCPTLGFRSVGQLPYWGILPWEAELSWSQFLTVVCETKRWDEHACHVIQPGMQTGSKEPLSTHPGQRWHGIISYFMCSLMACFGYWVLSHWVLCFVGNDGRCCVQLCRSHRTRCAGSIRGQLTLHVGHFRERHPLLVTESWVQRGPAFALARSRTEGAECPCRRAGSAVERPRVQELILDVMGSRATAR